MPRASSLADVVTRRATDVVTLRRKVAGAWTNLDPVSVHIDFTPTGSMQAASVLQTAGLSGESPAVQVICSPDVDIRVSDTFAHGGGLYRVEWVGPIGQGVHGPTVRIAIASAQKSPGVG